MNALSFTPRAMACALLCLGLAGTSSAEGTLGADAKARADAWIGRDASELLVQLRVDGGRLEIDEDDTSMETYYTSNTKKPGWTENVYGSVGDLRYIDHQVQHPPEHRCDITYVADRDGIIRRWEHDGPQCDTDIVGPKPRR